MSPGAKQLRDLGVLAAIERQIRAGDVAGSIETLHEYADAIVGELSAAHRRASGDSTCAGDACERCPDCGSCA